MLFLVRSSVLIISLFVTTSLQWKRELGPRRKKVREEDRASAIASEEDKELDQLLDEIMELFDESDKAIDKTKQKQEEEVKKEEEMQKRSLETFKDCAKKMQMNIMEQDHKKSRASGANTLAYLKDKAEVEAT